MNAKLPKQLLLQILTMQDRSLNRPDAISRGGGKTILNEPTEGGPKISLNDIGSAMAVRDRNDELLKRVPIVKADRESFLAFREHYLHYQRQTGQLAAHPVQFIDPVAAAGIFLRLGINEEDFMKMSTTGAVKCLTEYHDNRTPNSFTALLTQGMKMEASGLFARSALDTMVDRLASVPGSWWRFET